MKRKIIAIANRSGTNEENGSTIALADDGTLWEGYPHFQGNGKPYEWRWECLPGLPDDPSNLGKVRS